MHRKILLGIVILAVIAVLSIVGRYLYLNVFNNQYEFTYEIQKNKEWEPFPRSYKFTAPNDSVAAEKVIIKLEVDFDADNYTLEESNYRFKYKNLRLNNVTKDKRVRVPAHLIKETFLNADAIDLYKLIDRDVDWFSLTGSIPYCVYSMTIYLEHPYDEKDLRFISDCDFNASEKAIDTLAYCIANYWYYANRPIEDVLVVNNSTLGFVHAAGDNYVWNRLNNSPYCKGLNLNRYPISYGGLIYE